MVRKDAGAMNTRAKFPGSRPAWSGFTLVEILIVVAAIAILGGTVITGVRGVRESANDSKLEKDVATINGAIDTYRSAGGAIPAGADAQAVINLLKTRADATSSARTLGFTGSFIDPRTTIVAQPPTSSPLRAVYDAANFRFYTTRSGSGIPAFGLDEAAGAVAPTTETRERTLDQATAGKWVWDYADAAAAARPDALTPATEDGGGAPPVTGAALVQLQAPVISPAGGAGRNLTAFPLAVSIANPNPALSSVVYYSIDGGKPVLYAGSFAVDPEATVSAIAVSLDASRYANSGIATAAYPITPLVLSVSVTPSTGTLTYAQANDPAIPPKATVALGGSIPSKYISSANFGIYYTVDGSDPLTSASAVAAPSFNGSFPGAQASIAFSVWGDASSLTVRAVAKSLKPAWFTTSPVSQATFTIAPTELPVQVVPVNPVGLPPLVQMKVTGGLLTGAARVYYTLSPPSAGNPLDATSAGHVRAGVALTYPAEPTTGVRMETGASYTLVAQATKPGAEQWFSSAPTTRNYRAVTALPADFVGANISGGDVNGVFRGSIFVAAPANLGTFNAGGQISGGNLYVPGLPAIEIPGSSKASSPKTVVAKGQDYVEAGAIPRTLIAGKEFTADGQLADPQLDTRQVVDLNGSRLPADYEIKLTSSSKIEGKIYRRADSPPPPTPPTLPAGLTAVAGSFSGVPPQALVSGIYSNNVTMNFSNSVVRLGVAGSSTPTQYIFSGADFKKGTVEILGPVEVYFVGGFIDSGVIFGSESMAKTTRINVVSGDVKIDSGGSVFAHMWASTNNEVQVGNDGAFYGSIYAGMLTVSPNGRVNVE